MNCPVCDKEMISIPSKIVTPLGIRLMQKAWICTKDNLTVLQNCSTSGAVEILSQETLRLINNG